MFYSTLATKVDKTGQLHRAIIRLTKEALAILKDKDYRYEKVCYSTWFPFRGGGDQLKTPFRLSVAPYESP